VKTLRVRRYLDLLGSLVEVRAARGLESPEEEKLQNKLDALWGKLSPAEVAELRTPSAGIDRVLNAIEPEGTK